MPESSFLKVIVDGVSGNFASDILKHGIVQLADGTPLEKPLKFIGFGEADLDDHIQESLKTSFAALRIEHPNVQTSHIEKVMLQPALTKHITAVLQLGKIPDADELAKSLNNILKFELDLKAEFKKQNLDVNVIVTDFLKALRTALAQQQTADGLLVRWAIEEARKENQEEHQLTRDEMHKRFDELQKEQQAKPVMRCPKPLDAPQKFGGRDQYYATLMTQLKARDAGTVGISAMQGIGGIGKTTLARKVAYDLYQQQVFKAVVWTSVNQNPQIFSLLTHWGDYGRGNYAPTATDVEAVKAEVQTLLQAAIDSACATCEGERVLLVLDDVWADGVQTVKMLLSIQPRNSTVLITTRSTNVLIDLDVALPNVARLDYMALPDAVQMLRQWLQVSDTALLERLAKALDGHPLSLELAAKRVLKEQLPRPQSTWNTVFERCVQEYEAGLQAGTSFERLRLEQGEDKERNLTVSLQLSYNTLSPKHQQQFRALGILPFDAPFDANMLAALWAIDVEDVDFHLSDLLDLALLEVEPDNEGWYTQHRLLRAYAFALLNQHNESESTFRHYAEHITKVAYFFRENINRPEEWGILDPYLPHIHQVGDELVNLYAADNTAWGELALEFAANTETYLIKRPEALFKEMTGTRLPLRLNWFEVGLAVSRQLQKHSYEALFLSDLGLIHNNFGDKQKALDYYLSALNIFRELGAKGDEAVAVTLNNIGMVYDELGDQQQALNYYQQSLPIRRQVGDKSGEATTINNIGMVYMDLGDEEQALTYFKQVLPIDRQVGDKAGEAKTLNNIAGVYGALGDESQALSYFQQALSLSQVVGDKGQEATTLNNIAGAYYALGDEPQALSYFQQVVIISNQIGLVALEALAHHNIAVLKSSSNVGEAIHEMEQTIALMKSKNLIRDAGGGTLERYEAFLAELKRRRDGG